MAFNQAQRAAIDCQSNLVVLAPPGSGKTGTLTAKAIKILQTVPGSRVGMMTFTNAATQELNHRVKSMVAPDEFKRMRIATFHSHCMELLRTEKMLGKVVSPSDAAQLLRRAMSASGFPGKYEDASAEVERYKRDLAFTGDETPLVAAYEEIRRRHRSVDMNDIIRDAVNGILSGSIRPLDVTHLLADETQDSDLIQLRFMIAHANQGIITTIVGDDDQSVYGFRGSLGYEGMLQFEEETHASRILLEINYRSHAEILDCAGAVICRNVHRVDKAVAAAKGAGGKVRVRRVPNRALECKLASDLIKEDTPTNEQGLTVPRQGRWAILARTNSAFRLLVGQLNAEGIAHHILGGRAEMPEDALVFMQFLNSLQTGDSFGLEMTLSRAEVHPSAVEGLIVYFGSECHRYLDGEIPLLNQPLPEDMKIIIGLAQSSRRWRDQLELGHYERVIDGVALWFMDHGLVKSKTSEEDFAFWVKLLNRSKGSLSRRTERLLRKPDPKDRAGVTLCTMHTSKGLEFDRVIIVQANAGVIPSGNNPDVEEERRLFFVAITRAKSDLTVICQTAPGPSPFIAEMMASGVLDAASSGAS